MFVPPRKSLSPIWYVIAIAVIAFSMFFLFSLRQQVRRPVYPPVHDPR
jgi:hypothetical protein